MNSTHQEIVSYWSEHQDECGLSVDWAEALTLCWRCAQGRRLQRCHIVPRALGGSEEPRNLVLLCAQCHSEAPNVDDPEFMWVWLRAHAVCFYGTYWYHRGLREYEFVFKRKPFEGLKSSDDLIQRLHQATEQYIQKTSTHWGQGKLNPATIAWLLHKVLREAQNDD